MKKIFFFDVDDTLLPTEENAKIPESTKYAIKELQQAGHDVYIATGKNKKMIEKELELFDIHNFISSNGQAITINDELFHYNFIDYEEVVAIREEIKRQGNYVTGCQEYDNYYIDICSQEDYDKYVYPAFKDLSIPLPQFKRTRDLKPICQMWLLGEVDNFDTTPIEKNYSMFRWDELGYDIISKDVSKASAIKILLDEFYKDEEVQTYAFGDGNNDIAMFGIVDVAVAMGNANENVKKAATEITGTAVDGGIYEYLVKNNLIKEMN